MDQSDEGNGYMWRKYGEKAIGGARKHTLRRSYYRCVCFRSGAPCPAKKRVDRLLSEGADESSTVPVSVVFVNRHNDEALGTPCHRSVGDGTQADGLAGMLRELEHMRSQDLAREMVSDLMLQPAETGGWGGAPCARPGDASPGLDTSCDTSMEPCASGNEALASEAEELLSALLEGPKGCSLLPTRSLEAHSQRDELSPRMMDALALLNQERLASRAQGPGVDSYAVAASRSGHLLRVLRGSNSWMLSGPMPITRPGFGAGTDIRPQPLDLPGSNSSSSSNRGSGHSSRGHEWRALHSSFEGEASSFVSTEDAEYMLECLQRGLQAGQV